METKMQCPSNVPVTIISLWRALHCNLSLPSHVAQSLVVWPPLQSFPRSLVLCHLFSTIFSTSASTTLCWLFEASRQTCCSFWRISYRVEHTACGKFLPAGAGKKNWQVSHANWLQSWFSGSPELSNSQPNPLKYRKEAKEGLVVKGSTLETSQNLGCSWVRGQTDVGTITLLIW